MVLQKTIYLAGGTEEGIRYAYEMQIGANAFIGQGNFYIRNKPDLEKVKTRQADEAWCYRHIPSSIMWSGINIHHDWKNGGIMYLIPEKEHRRMNN